VDIQSKEELEAFEQALAEEGIDFDSLVSESPEESSAPTIFSEDGTEVGIDAVPAEPVKPPKKASKAKMGKSIKGYPTEAVDPTTAITIASKQKKHCVVEADDQTFTYKFVAPKSGKFFFYSEGSLDAVGRIMEYDSATDSYTEVDSDDQSGSNDNFRITLNAVSGKTYYLQAKLWYSDERGEFDVVIYPDEYTASISVKTYPSGNAYVTGKATGDTFYDIYVDGNRVYADIDGKTSFAYTIDMKEYSVGFHTISAGLNNHDAEVVYKYAVPTYIYQAPSIKTSCFETGRKCFTFSNNGNSYKYDSDCGTYVDYKKKGGKKWKQNYGPVTSYGSGKVKGLKPNTFYYIRAHYGKVVSYGGKSYFFTGKAKSKVSKNVKVKTGKKSKPPVKKIKISKVKQFKRTFSYTLWINYGGYMVPRYISNTYWYTSFKCTVYMKKKPKAAGIYIGNVQCKGNKKKYTADFTVSGKQKGKKLKFSVCTYQNATYKGFSPYYKKKVRIK
ncbi:MAG: hypothetical protein II696_04510, partial [Firmicutes bacterium]|nr:hypothetical protein [Bacillota bacterium]